jgi:hypothetical protein
LNRARAPTPARCAISRDFAELRIDFHAEAARAEYLRRGDHDAAVPRAEVDDEIVRAGTRKRQHALDHVVRRGDEGRAPLVLLRPRSARKRACNQCASQDGSQRAARRDHLARVSAAASHCRSGS